MRIWTRLGRPTALIDRIARDRRGATLIEFAFCSAAFMAMLLGAAQIALIYFAQQGIQTVAEKMARKLMTGEIRTATMTQAQFRTAACGSLPSYMTCSKLYADVQFSSEFDTLDTTPLTFTRDGSGNITNTFSYDAGGPGSIVMLRLFYPWKTVAGPMGMSLANGDGSDRILISTMVFQAEVYQ